MELCTPSAVLRTGAADPKAQQSCVPATAPRAKVIKQLSVCPSVRQPVCLSVFSVQSEYIEFRWSGERKY